MWKILTTGREREGKMGLMKEVVHVRLCVLILLSPIIPVNLHLAGSPPNCPLSLVYTLYFQIFSI